MEVTLIETARPLRNAKCGEDRRRGWNIEYPTPKRVANPARSFPRCSSDVRRSTGASKRCELNQISSGGNSLSCEGRQAGAKAWWVRILHYLLGRRLGPSDTSGLLKSRKEYRWHHRRTLDLLYFYLERT